MASTAAFAGQFGYVSETVPGTPLTVTKFVPILSKSAQWQQVAHIPFRGHRAGRRVQYGQKAGRKVVGGSLSMELPNKDIATLLKHCMGAVNTTGAGPYTHTLTPGDLQSAKAMTMQFGVPDQAGTVQPFTNSGCKINSWSLSGDTEGAVTLELEVAAMTETTGTALATASYTSGQQPFVWSEAAVSLAGSALPVESWSISGNNGLKTDRFRTGASTTLEPLEASRRAYTGSLTADFSGLTAYGRSLALTEAALVITLTSGTDVLTITTNAVFTGDTPELPEDGVVMQPLPFNCTSSTSDAAAITLALTNGDSSAA